MSIPQPGIPDRADQRSTETSPIPTPAPYDNPLESPKSNKSDSDHEHEHRDTHHELPSVSKFPRPRAPSRSAATGSKPLSVQPLPFQSLRPRSGSNASSLGPSRAGSLNRHQNAQSTSPAPPPPSRSPNSASPNPDESQVGGTAGAASFAPLAPTESRVSAMTYIEPAGVITGYPELARSASRASRAGTFNTIEKRREGEGEDEKEKDLEEGPGEGRPDENGVVQFTFPDGGSRAWICVGGGAAALFCGFGLAPTAGVFQTYYQKTFLQDYSSSTIAWIGSAQAALAFGPAAFTGSLFDLYGHRPLIATGTVFLILGYCMLSLCTKYYQIFLCHATLIPFGMNMMFLSPVGVVSQWFHVNRGRAFGIMTAGAALGSTIWPIIWANLPDRIGFPWTMRLVALICGVLGVTSFFCLKTRLPPKPPGPFFYFAFFKDPTYVCLTAGMMIYVFSFFNWMIFVQTGGELRGLSIAKWLMIILNGSSCVGRLATSLVADRLGMYNLTAVSCVLMTLLYWIWLACKTSGSLIALNVVFGIVSGTFVSLQAPLVVRLIPDVRLSGTAVGQVLLFQAVGQLVGPPITGAVLGDGTTEEKLHRFTYCIILGAVAQTICVGFLFVCRFRLSRKLWARV